MKLLSVALLGLTFCLPAQAGLIVTLTDGGPGLTSMHIFGTGTTGEAFSEPDSGYFVFPGPRIVLSMWDPVNIETPGDFIQPGLQGPGDVIVDFPDVGFIGGSLLAGITIFQEGYSDEFHLNLFPGSSFGAGEAIDFSLTTLIQADFSRFNPGIYTVRPGGNYETLFGTSGFQLVIATTVPEPSTLALFALGLLGLGFARRRA